MPATFSDPDMQHGTCVAVSFKVDGGENVPGIPGACATRNFTYLVRSPLKPGYAYMMYHCLESYFSVDHFFDNPWVKFVVKVI